VKSLAQQTGRATDEISTQISSVQYEAGNAVQAIRSIGAIITDVQAISASIASSVAQQDAATREISSNVGRVVQDIEGVSSSIRGVTSDLRKSGRIA
jgi:methyl-accepting chemotaxis protein